MNTKIMWLYVLLVVALVGFIISDNEFQYGLSFIFFGIINFLISLSDDKTRSKSDGLTKKEKRWSTWLNRLSQGFSVICVLVGIFFLIGGW